MTIPHTPVRQVLLFSENDPLCTQELVLHLQAANLWVAFCPNYVDALHWLGQNEQQQPDLVMIDIPSERSIESANAFNLYGLVRKGGWIPALERRFLGWGEEVPIMMLIDEASRLSVEQRMYHLGINPEKIDYKPYHPHLLIHKITNLVKLEDNELLSPASTDLSKPILRLRALTIDPETETARIGTEPIKLSELEFKLLYYLACHTDIPLSREQILAEIWGIEGKKAVNNRNVDVYIGRLRRKLAQVNCHDLIGRGHNGAYILESAKADAEISSHTEQTEMQVTDDFSPSDARLICQSDGLHLSPHFALQGGEIAIKHRAGIKIGRCPDQSDCVINDMRVSRWHATLYFNGDHFYIRDENSRGGTYLVRQNHDGKRQKWKLVPREHAKLAHGDVLYFSKVAYRFELSSE